MPFEEVQHTADWSLRVWADSLPGLFAECAQGMLALSGVRLAASPRVARALEFTAIDLESLLVSFLSELLFIQEDEHIAFDEFNIQLEGNSLQALAGGASILSMDKAIKAVTYHNLHIRQNDQDFEVEIVFDV